MACTERALIEVLAPDAQPPLYSDELREIRQATYNVLLRLAREEALKKDLEKHRRLAQAIFGFGRL